MFITRLDRRAPATVTFQSAVQLAARDIEVGGMMLRVALRDECLISTGSLTQRSKGKIGFKEGTMAQSLNALSGLTTNDVDERTLIAQILYIILISSIINHRSIEIILKFMKTVIYVHALLLNYSSEVV